MKKIANFAVIGGDLRFYYLAEALIDSGYSVNAYGFNNLDKNIKQVSNINDAISNSEAVILPLPVTVDKINLNAPFSYTKIPVAELFSYFDKNQYIFGGQIGAEILPMIKSYGLRAYDYYDREELIVRNAIPTAEGGIQIAMERLPYTLNGSSCLITGYGRISKVLIRMLEGIGAKITVAARKPWDIAWASSFGNKAIHISELAENASKFDVIFNTVPSKIIDKQTISALKPDCFIIDLASKPGGVDLEAAKAKGIQTNWALSLPGKVAPLTAGQIIKDTIFNILREEEE